MQLLYNSDSFAVVQIELPAAETAAETGARGVQALVDAEEDREVSAEVMDDFISGWTIMAQQPLVLH